MDRIVNLNHFKSHLKTQKISLKSIQPFRKSSMKVGSSNFLMSPFAPQNVLSQLSRQRCLKNLKTYPIPQLLNPPLAKAAILIPICLTKDKVSLLYTIRSTKLRSHSGQIAFPGGKQDEGETPIDTALRETHEEIGVPHNKIDVWGSAPSVPGRNNSILITPVVGSIIDFKEDKLKLNPEEVSEVFYVPLEDLCNPDAQFHNKFPNGYILPVFIYEAYKIWGVTAYITHMFLSSLLTQDVYTSEWLKKRIEVPKTS